MFKIVIVSFFFLYAFTLFPSNPYLEAQMSPLLFPKVERETGGEIKLKYFDVDFKKEEIEEFKGRKSFIVKFEKNIQKDDISALSGLNVQFLSRIKDNLFLISCDYYATIQIESLGGSLMHYNSKWKVDPILFLKWDAPLVVESLLIKNFHSKEVLKLAKGNFLITQIDGGNNFDRLRWLIKPEDIREFVKKLAEIDDVILVYPFFLPIPLNDDSIWVIQSYDIVNQRNYTLSATIFNHQILGENEIATVCDTGIDNDMCYFAYSSDGYATAQYLSLDDVGVIDDSKKVIAYSVLPGATAYDNNSACYAPNQFHGTHTSCTLLGDNFKNIASNTDIGHNTADGMAPMAKLYFQDAGDDTTGCLLGLANDYKKIFLQSYRGGARVHSNSWGANSDGEYTSDCYDVDTFIYENDDFTICFAAGNSGSFSNTINTPASAKNCITVGSVTNGSILSNTVSSFSSRGPTKDGRIKPDLVAPGENILSAAGDSSSQDGNCSYKYLSGTSMATPTLAGGAILIRNYFTKGFYPSGENKSEDSFSPSSALVKASLIASAMDVGVNDFPNFSEGFGRINLDRFCYFKENERDNIREIVYDVRNYAGLKEGEVFEVEAKNILKVVLVWTDPPGSLVSLKTLVNDLDLEVVSPSQKIYLGNQLKDGFSVEGGEKDSLNNVEIVNFQSGEDGFWKVRVKGSDVKGSVEVPYSDLQGFALVILKEREDVELPSPQNLTAEDKGEEGIELNWQSVDLATSYSIYRVEMTGKNEGKVSFISSTKSNSFTDKKVEGGFSYKYFVRAAIGGIEGQKSNFVEVTSTKRCDLYPTFFGVKDGYSNNASNGCAITLNWDSAASNCPFSKGIKYNIYRDEIPNFTPSNENIIASSFNGLTFTDTSIPKERTYFYIVRSKEVDGEEDKNSKFLNITPFGDKKIVGDLVDDGGDNYALFKLEGSWTISDILNHTPNGKYCYSLSKKGENYPSNDCSTLKLQNIEVSSENSTLSYYVNYNLEYGWDGVVVEVSEDGGKSFYPLTPLEGYPSSFFNTGNPPINACKYPYSQACFSGPQNNDSLSNWQKYTHSLGIYAGKTITIQFRFSSDPAAQFEGFFLDDIELTEVYKRSPCLGTTPYIILNKEVFGCYDTIGVTLYDASSNNLDQVTLLARSDSEQSYEEFTLFRDLDNRNLFNGEIFLSPDIIQNDMKVGVKDGDKIHLDYFKDDINSAFKTASADCNPPSISLLSFTYLDKSTILFSILLSEPSSLIFEYGESDNLQYLIEDDSFSTQHQILLENLNTCRDYSYRIKLKDYADNSYSSEIKEFSTKGCFLEPKITSIKTLSNPFRIVVLGENFLEDSLIMVNGGRIPETKFKRSTKLIGKKGKDLKSFFPKGVEVEVKVFNQSDLTYSQPYYFKR